MFDFTAGEGGLLASARRAVGRVVGVVETRVELLSVELQEEKLRAVQLLICAGAVVFLSALALVLFSLTLLLSVWDNPQYRLAGMVLLTLLYAGGAVAAACYLNKLLKCGAKPFAETLDQLKKDRECLKD